MMNAAVLLLLPAIALAVDQPPLAVGDRFPQLRGEFLTGKQALLPEAAGGKISLLLMGFTYQSRFAVEAWAEKFQAQFRGEPRAMLFEIPMIGGLARLGKWFIDSGMRRGTPKEDHDRVITVYGDTTSWKQRVQFREPGAAYLILLDRSGNVTWRHQGAFDPRAFAELTQKVTELVQAP